MRQNTLHHAIADSPESEPRFLCQTPIHPPGLTEDDLRKHLEDLPF